VNVRGPASGWMKVRMAGWYSATSWRAHSSANSVFGSVFLTMDADGTGHSDVSVISGHALFLTLAWIAVTLAGGAAAAVPLARTVRATARNG
jgi:hypothetical protein